MNIVWISTKLMTFGLVLDAQRVVIDAAPIGRRYIGWPMRDVHARFRYQPGYQVAWWCEL